MISTHYLTDRENRERLIQSIGEGQTIASFIVDKGHPNGPERHEVTNTGIIVIYNALSNKLVTKLIARPNQIRRYFQDGKAPQDLIDLAKKHQACHYNKV